MLIHNIVCLNKTIYFIIYLQNIVKYVNISSNMLSRYGKILSTLPTIKMQNLHQRHKNKKADAKVKVVKTLR